MRSSTGQHFVALDHVRALAAFLVFAWHFMHRDNGHPVPFEGIPVVFPLALIDEGHTGVALFMTLSGYLFAKLLDGRDISYAAFLWNRVVRLGPLLLLVFLFVAALVQARGGDTPRYLVGLLSGLIFPVWPNGGWSITVELHFYVLLPGLLWVSRRSRSGLLLLVLCAVLVRWGLFVARGEIQTLAYWTIVGRIDQFTLGMTAFLFASRIAAHPRIALSIVSSFLVFWAWFDARGGFYFTSHSPLWIVIPTLEGAAYATLIAWYDSSAPSNRSLLSKLVQKIGEYSYSMYLLHFFVVFGAAAYVHDHVMNISNFYAALAWAAAMFLTMLAPGYLSFRYIEAPFLRLRKRYVM